MSFLSAMSLVTLSRLKYCLESTSALHFWLHCANFHLLVEISQFKLWNAIAQLKLANLLRKSRCAVRSVLSAWVHAYLTCIHTSSYHTHRGSLPSWRDLERASHFVPSVCRRRRRFPLRIIHTTEHLCFRARVTHLLFSRFPPSSNTQNSGIKSINREHYILQEHHHDDRVNGERAEAQRKHTIKSGTCDYLLSLGMCWCGRERRSQSGRILFSLVASISEERPHMPAILLCVFLLCGVSCLLLLLATSSSRK